MKNLKLFIATILISVFLFTGSIAKAQWGGSGNWGGDFWKLTGNVISLVNDSWTLLLNSITMSGNIDMDGNDILNADHIETNTIDIVQSVNPGPLRVATSSATDIQFLGDTDTGLNWIDPNELALVAGGNNSFIVTNTGVEYAGTLTTPLTANSITYIGSFQELTEDINFVYNNGNLGIGTSSPYAKLSVVGETVSSYFSATSTTATSTFPNLSSTQLSLGLTAGSIPFSNGTFLAQDNSNLFWDDSNNRLGIGTSSPLSLLTIDGTNPTVSMMDFVNGAHWQFGSSAGIFNIREIDPAGANTGAKRIFRISSGGLTRWNLDKVDADFRFDGTSDNLLYLDSGNNRVGIGTNAPSEKLSLPDDTYIGMGGTGVDSKIGYDSGNNLLDIDLTGSASGTGLNISADNDANLFTVGDNGTYSTIGIGQAANPNRAKINMTTDSRYGIEINHTTSGTNPNTIRGTLNTTAASQGTAFDFTAISTGSTAPSDWLLGANTITRFQRNLDISSGDIRQLGLQSANYYDVAMSANRNLSNYVMGGADYTVGAGPALTGAGKTATIGSSFGIRASLVNVMQTNSSQALVLSDHRSISIPKALSQDSGLGNFSATNLSGIWIEELDFGTNNSLLVLGDSNTTGNYSIYNNSGYNSLLLGGTAKGYIGDTNSYIHHDGTNLTLVDDVKVDINNSLFALPSGNVGIGTSTPSSTLDIYGSQTNKVTEINSATYTIQDDDYFICSTYSSTGQSTTTLPVIGNIIGRQYEICDCAGNANTNWLYVDTADSAQILSFEYDNELIINVDGGCATLMAATSTMWKLK